MEEFERVLIHLKSQYGTVTMTQVDFWNAVGPFKTLVLLMHNIFFVFFYFMLIRYLRIQEWLARCHYITHFFV